jgi:hypothetical protein
MSLRVFLKLISQTVALTSLSVRRRLLHERVLPMLAEPVRLSPVLGQFI